MPRVNWITSAKAASINAQYEWRNNKDLRVSCNDEATIIELFSRYHDFINEEKKSVQDPYEVSKLQRSPGTLTKIARFELSAEKESDLKDVYSVKSSSTTLITHEIFSRVWVLEARLMQSTPKRLLGPTVFDNIATQANCRILFNVDTGTATVKADNDEDLCRAMERLESFAQALSLYQIQPQTYNVVNQEDERNIRFRLTSLAEHEARDQRATTIIDQRLLQGSQQPLAVILMTSNTGDRLTCSRSIHSCSPATLQYDVSWPYGLINPYGSQTGPSHDTTVHSPGPDLAPKSIAEWVATIQYDTEDPSKPLEIKEPIETLPTRWVDALEADGTDNNETSLPKKRFGRSRKKPGLDDITEIEDNKEVDHTDDRSLYSTPNALLSSAEGRPLLSTGLIPHLEISTQLASVTSISKTPSHSGSQRSPQGDTSSSIPSTHISDNQDLLMLTELELAYPVITPNLAIQNHKAHPQTSRASDHLQSQAKQPPAWVRRNVTSQAENQKPRQLIDCGESQPPNREATSYLAVAKRGISAAQKPRGLGRASPRGQFNNSSTLSRRQQAPTNSESQAYIASHQSAQWAAPEVIPKAKPKLRSIANPKATQQLASENIHGNAAKEQNNDVEVLTIIQTLRSAGILDGTATMEVEIGRILIKHSSVQPNKSNSWAHVYNTWSAIFDSPNGKETETIFTNRLPNPHTNLGLPANIKQQDGQQYFADDPYDCNIIYQFFCETNLGDEEVLLRISEQGTVQAFSSERVIGAIQWHYPKRQWDARLVVKTSERICHYDDAVKAVSSSLVIVPSPDQTTASISADLGNSGLVFKSASILRKVQFRCLADPDIIMICTEVQHLGPAKERQSFFNSAIDRAATAETGDLWWEIKLESVEIQQANWSAEDIIQKQVTERLHAVATSVVTQIDGLGAGIRQPTIETSSKTATESWKPSKTSTLVADTFW
ncbi:MAG: hypothetical protein Q9209_005101 [Squamulea sp. 1 TL-2023]